MKKWVNLLQQKNLDLGPLGRTWPTKKKSPAFALKVIRKIPRCGSKPVKAVRRTFRRSKAADFRGFLARDSADRFSEDSAGSP